MELAYIYILLAAVFGLFMAWGIGANDVANAMAPAVGSRAVTIKQAIVIAAVFEFAGAVLAGGGVTSTIRAGLVDNEMLAGSPELLVYGMLASLLAAGTWLLLASTRGWPVSTTHSIVGAVVGFAAVGIGIDAVQWGNVAWIGVSWVISPIVASIIAWALFVSVQRLVLETDDPLAAARRWVPVYIFLVGFMITVVTLLKGLKHVGLDLSDFEAYLYAALLGVGVALIGRWAIQRIPFDADANRDFHYATVEKIFGVLMLVTACAMAFAHGSNDVANAIGPVAAVISIAQSGTVEQTSIVSPWLLVLGGIGIVLHADALGVTFALLSSIVVLAALVHESLEGVRSRTFPALAVMLATGLTGLFLTGDIFNFYVFFELAMVAAYVLTAYGDKRQLGAALIFAVVNLIGSFIFLIAIAATYHVTGTLAMDDVAARMADVEPSAAILIAATFFVAFGTKLGLFPFHFWLPSVYARTRPAVAAILSGALANIGAYGLLRFGADLLPNELKLASTVLIVIGSISVIYGALLAVSRRDSAEMLAYSAIGQAGYVIIALGVGGPVGLAAAVLYAILNSLSKALLFLSGSLRGVLVAGAFAVGTLSLAGVPPTAGFIGKLELFRTGVETGSAALVLLLFAGGALAFLYAFQLYQHEFWRGTRAGGAGVSAADASPAGVRAVSVVLALIVLGLGIWPEPLLSISADAAAVLGEGGP